MITTKFKVKKVVERNAHGILEKKFIPICRKAIFGIGFWKECKGWDEVEQKIREEKFLGIDPDSTLTHIRTFIDERDPNPRNEFYNE